MRVVFFEGVAMAIMPTDKDLTLNVFVKPPGKRMIRMMITCLRALLRLTRPLLGGNRRINIRANGQKGHKDGVQRPNVLRLAWRNGMVNAVRLPPQPQRHRI